MSLHPFSMAALAILAFVAWQLITGRAYTKQWRIVAREDNPGDYWVLVIGEGVMGAAAFALGQSGFFV